MSSWLRAMRTKKLVVRAEWVRGTAAVAFGVAEVPSRGADHSAEEAKMENLIGKGQWGIRILIIAFA